MVPLMNPATKASASATRAKRIPAHMIVTSPAVIRTYAAADYTGKSCRLALRCLGGDPPWCSAAARWRPLRCGLARASAQPRRHLERDFRTRPLDAGPYTVAAADALTTKVREGGRVNVHTSVATGVNACARTGSPVPIGGEPFRQRREHGHGRFWPLLQYGV
jgi:hypothetical protein